MHIILFLFVARLLWKKRLKSQKRLSFRALDVFTVHITIATSISNRIQFEFSIRTSVDTQRHLCEFVGTAHPFETRTRWNAVKPSHACKHILRSFFVHLFYLTVAMSRCRFNFSLFSHFNRRWNFQIHSAIRLYRITVDFLPPRNWTEVVHLPSFRSSHRMRNDLISHFNFWLFFQIYLVKCLK